MIDGYKAEFEGVIQVAKLMCVAARTAPKTKGMDSIVTRILVGKEELERLAEVMDKLADELGYKFFKRDADNIRRSFAVVLIGVKMDKPLNLDCQACGFKNCLELFKHIREMKCFRAPLCAMKLIDLGIAVGSAVKIASTMNVDNRIMFSVGVAAVKAGLIDADIAMGIPLSAYGKNIYFDRKKR